MKIELKDNEKERERQKKKNKWNLHLISRFYLRSVTSLSCNLS